MATQMSSSNCNPSSFQSPIHHRYPHPFPTRRSSDLLVLVEAGTLTHEHDFGVPMPLTGNGLGAPDVEAAIGAAADLGRDRLDRKSTRLNSSHQIISYAVFCLKKKNRTTLRLLSVSHT